MLKITREKEKNVVKEVIKALMAERDWSCQDLADECGEPVETIKNIYYGRTTNPHGDILVSISEAFGVTVNYLYGHHFLSDEERELIDCYRMCGKHGKSIMAVIAKYEAYTAKAERDAKDKHLIPCILPKDAACDGMKYDSNNMTKIYTTEPDAFIALQVPSNNWHPRYCKDDIILLADRFPRHNEEALFTKESKVYFRKYIETEKGYILRCVNNRHEDIKVRRMDEYMCFGTSVGIVRA